MSDDGLESSCSLILFLVILAFLLGLGSKEQILDRRGIGVLLVFVAAEPCGSGVVGNRLPGVAGDWTGRDRVVEAGIDGDIFRHHSGL